MTTEQEIQQIGDRLQQLINTDNDAPRFIKEYLPNTEISILEGEIRYLKEELDYVHSENESLEEELKELRAQN